MILVNHKEKLFAICNNKRKYSKSLQIKRLSGLRKIEISWIQKLWPVSSLSLILYVCHQLHKYYFAESHLEATTAKLRFFFHLFDSEREACFQK